MLRKARVHPLEVAPDLDSIMILPRIMGSFLLGRNGKVSYLAVARHLFTVAFYFYSFLLQMQELDQALDNILFLVMSFLTTCLFATYFMSLYRRHRFLSMLRCLSRPRSIATVPKWPRLLGFSILCIRTTAEFALFNRPFDKHTLSFQYKGYLINSLVDECSCFLLLIGNRFRSLSRALFAATTRRAVRSLVVEFDTLRQATNDLNSFYSIQNLFTFGICFIIASTSMLLIIKGNSISLKIEAFIEMIIYIQISTRIVLSASYLVKQAGKFDIKLYEKIKESPQSWNSPVDLDLLFCDRSIKITAADYFQLKEEQLGTMIAAATTYLVILLQVTGH